MNTYDRMGIHIEQCESCRGIFLDHGELEQLLSAEKRYGGGMPAAAPPPYRSGGHGYSDSPRPHGGHGYGHSDSPRPYGGRGHGYSDSPRPYGQKRKKSFLEQLFD